MRITAKNIARARFAMRRALRNHLLDPNASLIDIGMPTHGGVLAEDELAIRFHVKKKLSGITLQAAAESGFTRPIPPHIDDIPTDVQEATYRPGRWTWGSIGWQDAEGNSPTSRFDPMRGGISISDEYHFAAGTLGCKVLDRITGEEMILSNWHVLVTSWTARAGQQILQPGQLDGGTFTDAVAALTRDAMGLNLDAAVATLNGSRQLLNDQLSIGRLTGVAQPQLEMQLCKSGRTSNVTFGLVTGTDGVTSPIQYDSITRIIKSVVTIDPPSTFEQVSAAGDSGSCWLDPKNNRAVALHFAGSDFPQRALAMDMQTVLDALEVDLATAPEAVTAGGLAGRSQAVIPLFRVRIATRVGRPDFNSGSREAAHLKREDVWR